MGSLPASGIPVVAKSDTTYRKRDIKITTSNSVGDTVADIVTVAPVRVIGSGSIVRDNGLVSSVEYHEELVWGVTRMARTCLERIPSDVTCVRQTVVDLGDGETIAVIPTALTPHTPQLAHRHTGNSIVEGQAVGDIVVERIPNSGVYSA